MQCWLKLCILGVGESSTQVVDSITQDYQINTIIKHSRGFCMIQSHLSLQVVLEHVSAYTNDFSELHKVSTNWKEDHMYQPTNHAEGRRVIVRMCSLVIIRIDRSMRYIGRRHITPRSIISVLLVYEDTGGLQTFETTPLCRQLRWVSTRWAAAKTRRT